MLTFTNDSLTNSITYALIMKSRKKAQDIFEESNLVFGSKTTFDKGYPEVERISVRVEEFDYSKLVHETSFIDKSTISEFINCHNALCKGGGFHLMDVVREMYRTKEIKTTGHKLCIGSERKGRDCMHQFKYEINITYVK